MQTAACANTQCIICYFAALSLKIPSTSLYEDGEALTTTRRTVVTDNAVLQEVITEENWEEIERLAKFLETFYSITITLEVNKAYGSL